MTPEVEKWREEFETHEGWAAEVVTNHENGGGLLTVLGDALCPFKEGDTVVVTRKDPK